MWEFPVPGGLFGEMFLRGCQHWRQLKGVSGEDTSDDLLSKHNFQKVKKKETLMQKANSRGKKRNQVFIDNKKRKDCQIKIARLEKDL